MKTAYCFSCQQVRKVMNPKQVKINNRPAVEGTCPVCGKKIFRIARPESARATGDDIDVLSRPHA